VSVDTIDAAPVSAPPAGRALGYTPALDGLRGLAVLAIIVYHTEIRGTHGTFLGVSTFFTLSGFLLTTITLADHRRTGRVAVGRFYARRARRLLPAALVTILVAGALTLAWGTSTQVANLRGDALSALFYVGNWHLILDGQSYGAIFQTPSLYTHFWSLGIEEQFYLAFPLALALGLRAGRGSRRALAAGLVVIVVASTAWSAHLVGTAGGIDRAFFGTDTRIAELAVGCLLALWWARTPEVTGRAARALQGAGVAALVAILVVWHVASRDDEFLYRGGLALYAVLSALVILAAVQPRGLIPRVLGVRPLVAMGAISYGAYLIHWPLMVVIRQQTSFGAVGRLIVVLPLTIVLAAASARWVERPVRTGGWPPARVAPRVAAAALVACALVVVAATALRGTPETTPDFAASAAKLEALAPPPGLAGNEALTERLTELGEMTQAEADPDGRYADLRAEIAGSTAPRVGFFGDSSAVMSGVGIFDWALDHLDQLAPSAGSADLGCGLVDGGRRKVGDQKLDKPDTCEGWMDRWEAAVTDARVDIAVVEFGSWEVRDQQIRSGGPYLTIGEDPALDQAITDNLDAAVTRLLDHVGMVALVSYPDVVFGRDGGRDPRHDDPASDPARMARYRQIVAEVAARHPRVAVVDLAGWVAGRADDKRLRPDGVHFSEKTTVEVAGDWFAPELLRLYAFAGNPPGAAAP
jgi:peptidoglycan/LPS O-acetylase OafA/YrhL